MVAIDKKYGILNRRRSGYVIGRSGNSGFPPERHATGATATAIYNGTPKCVTNIGYDLRAKSFARAGQEEDSCELKPGESVFVTSEEIVQFDHHTVGKPVFEKQ